MSINNLSNAVLAMFYRDAVGTQTAALELDRDDLYAAACEITKLYRTEIQRRTLEAVETGNQAALRALNAALANDHKP